ncbi:RnfABCDGE type electron transport complex subunit D [Pseudomonas monteilii]|uniref:RnfABCDGE type electron transport complex subunit D n=1 Tax=Pseudomonas TaxID=286 RepID=UPI00053579FA|nr:MULTISPECIES: RnfABCDGE type electron transport complex subunit D [Pseudomonas]MBA1315236.1 RnfABCDGE type electron transport complex subunit D [Pseudomonas monteilii]MCE1015956.1 RnfABCDGE type electron transport complex subunit D [Pseudomonas monteilii]MCE1035910.1 RnfABCDGE type electron transport complex subunit D [Pseudomonas monteilii]MCE1086768.1 RnfABCDGE type electron transport complex subunit D [Pseudomonas monteilii]MDH0020150.1 RnfABCDGE type electron transport complex subunit D
MISQPDPRLRTSMGLVLLACLPGLLALLWLHGWGMLLNLLLSATAALLCEAVLLALRGQTLSTALGDGSALVTAVLLAAALPTLAPWWLPVVAASVAIGFGKQAFGGVGRNPFNPAMVGYAFVLLSFPLQMNHWPGQPPGLLESLQQVFTGGEQIDAWARPTLLDGLRHNRSLTIEELFASHPGFGNIGGRGSEWVNLAFLLGGLFLLQRNVISWHAPLGLLTGLFVFSLLSWNGSGSDSNGSPLLHLFSGSTMLAAFFIATEPVSGPRNERARLYFGLGAGLLIYLIRTWGSYPDGTAFAVLLMNLMVPTLERLTAQPQQAAR